MLFCLDVLTLHRVMGHCSSHDRLFHVVLYAVSSVGIKFIIQTIIVAKIDLISIVARSLAVWKIIHYICVVCHSTWNENSKNQILT